jgi:hypothetical protein
MKHLGLVILALSIGVVTLRANESNESGGRRVRNPPDAEPMPWLTDKDVKLDLLGLSLEQLLPAMESLSCSPTAPGFEYIADLRCIRWTSEPAVDADGSIYFTTEDTGIRMPPYASSIWRTRRDGKTERVAHIEPRLVPPGIWMTGSFQGFVVDVVRGQLNVLLRSSCQPTKPDQECRGGGAFQVLRIAGLPVLKSSRAGDQK